MSMLCVLGNVAFICYVHEIYMPRATGLMYKIVVVIPIWENFFLVGVKLA